VSPRGDPAGSVLVVDEHTLAFGDRKGNRRLDSMINIVQHAQASRTLPPSTWTSMRR